MCISKKNLFYMKIYVLGRPFRKDFQLHVAYGLQFAYD